jgi:hypothetical protein
MPDDNTDKLVPHQHLKNKKELYLPKELRFHGFIQWLDAYIK